jgi:ubiquinone/menaquinone biosynthesis C-methylase UbiE
MIGNKGNSTSWGHVAGWYDKHLAAPDTYHDKVLEPNMLRLVEPKSNDEVLDLGCGQGYFSRMFAAQGAKVCGVDISKELVEMARKYSSNIDYHVGTAEELSMFSDKTFDKATIVLAIQNIERADLVFNEVARVLKNGGVFHVVMNHPAFRIPRHSTWGYDDKKHVQFRRVEEYLSESKAEIEMHPSSSASETTVSFHRPLQYYAKALANSGFVISRIEEWTSHKTSDSGPRAKTENSARKEIPLFLYLQARKGGNKT